MSLPKHLLAIPLAILVMLSFLPVPPLCAQEAVVDAPKQVDQVDATKPVDQEEPSLAEQIKSLLKDKDPTAARKILTAARNADSDESKTESNMILLSNLHQLIAVAFRRQGEHDEAVDELATSFDFAMGYPDTVRKASSLHRIAYTMNLLGARSDKQEAIATRIDQAIEYCRKIEAENAAKVQFPLSSLVIMRATALSREDKSSAKEMLMRQIENVDSINATLDATEQTIAAQFQLLAVAGSLIDDFDDRDRIEKLLDSGMKSFPNSERVLLDFARVEHQAVRNLAGDDPSAATTRLESALARLSPFAEDNDKVKRMADRIKALAGQIEATAKQQDMLGKPAPSLEFDAWANVDEFNVDDLKGKVVLYDFWAVWCGPCIGTFPHLRTWREEYGDKGFEIVGITKYYNFEWNEDAGRATRSEEVVDPEVERSTIAKFLQSNEIQHPAIFTPKDSSLWQEYGVTGIPHAVLVDRNGNVQLVVVGGGQKNADELHQKIKELIGE